jgi:hemerythrin-like domain-containing protein
MATPVNGLDLLETQHGKIRQLLAAVESASDSETRKQVFDELRELIAVHETAEEIILRPVTRSKVTDGESIAQARMDEENKGKDVLAKLEKMDVSDAEFMSTFTTFKADVEEHAQHEESLEFPALREALDGETLETVGKRIQQAEAAAPTHAHPSARTTTANVVLGPFAAIVDRVRDALAS